MKSKWKKNLKKIAAVAITVVLVCQTAEPLMASIKGITADNNQKLDLRNAKNTTIPQELFEQMNVIIEQRGEIAAAVFDFTLSKSVELAEERTQEPTMEIETEMETEIETEAETEMKTEAETEVETEAKTEVTTETESTKETEVSTAMETPTKEEKNQTTEETTQTSEMKTVENKSYQAALSANQTGTDSGVVEKEEITFQVHFSDFFTIHEDMKSGEIVMVSEDSGENGKPIGKYELTQSAESGNIDMAVTIHVPKYREETLHGTIQCYLGLPENVEKLSIVWEEANSRVIGEDIGKLTENAFRTPLRGKLVAKPLPKAEIVPSESVTTKIDIKQALQNLPTDNPNQMYAKIFKKAKLSLTTTRGSQSIRVKVDAEVDDTFLESGFEELVGKYDDLPEGDKGELSVYLDNIANYEFLQELILPFSFGSEFTTVTGEDVKTPLTLEGDTAEADTFGYYELIRQDDGTPPTDGINMKCILNKKLYTKTGVTLGYEYELKSEKTLEPNEIYTFVESEDKIAFGENKEITVEGEPTEAEGYRITKEKTGAYSQTDPYANYKIEVKSFQVGGLNEATVEDILPVGSANHKKFPMLVVNRVFLKTDNEARRELIKGETGTPGTYQIEEGAADSGETTLRYTFPAGPAAPEDVTVKKTTRATLEVETMLSPTALLMMNSSSDPISFTNKAKLTTKGDTPVIKETTAGPDSKQYKMFKKEGKQSTVNASRMEWEIHVNAAFTGAPVVYLVDTLDKASHNYIDSSKIVAKISTKQSDGTISQETREIALKAISPAVDANVDNTYENVSAAILAGYDTAAGNPKAFYYTASNGENIMALKISDFLSSMGEEKQEQSLTISYATQIAETTDTGTKNFSNQADLRWRYGNGGMGPDWTPDFDFGIDKEASANLNVVNKRPSTYAEDTQMQEWLFDVNSNRQNVGNVVITENFAAEGASQILPDPIVCKVKTVHQHSNNSAITSGMDIPKKESDTQETPYYVIGDAGESISIHLGQVTAADCYIVSLQTKVSGAVTSLPNPDGTDGNVKVTNTANISDEDGNSYGNPASAENVIPNTLIEKKAKDSYDFTTNELMWEVTANPNALTIKKAAITDTLPKDNIFGRLTKVSYGKTGSVSSISDTTNGLVAVPNTVGGNADSSQKLNIDVEGVTKEVSVRMTRKADTTNAQEEYQFELVDAGGTVVAIKEPITLQFTTKLSKKYLDAPFFNPASVTDIRENGIRSTNFVNTAALSGTIMDRSKVDGYTVNASASAAHMVDTKPFQKQGSYDAAKPGRIMWSAVINQSKGNVAGVSITDTLDPALPLEFNTDEATYGLYEAKAAADGTVTKTETDTSAALETALNIDPQTNALSFQFKDGENTKTYILEFETFILEDAEFSGLTNKMELLAKNGERLSSNTAAVQNGGSFSTNEYATAKDTPILMLEKVSTSTDASGLHQIKFPNVKFTVTPQKEEGGNWVDDTSAAEKIKETNAKGKRIFVNFQPGTLYKITENSDTTPQGYQTCAPIYIYWKVKDAGDAPSNLPTGTRLEVSEKFYYKLLVENEPTGGTQAGTVKFVKKEESGTVLPNVTFELFHKQGLVKPQTQASDANGLVTFENVDPGSYTLKEVSAPPQFAIGGPFEVTKTADSHEITGTGVITENTDITISNKLAAAPLTIIKEDDLSGDKLQGAAYTLTGTNYLGDPVSMPVSSQTAVTGADGTLTFSDIPITSTESGKDFYTLTETVYPKGYEKKAGVETKYKVLVTAENNKAKIKVTEFDNTNTVLSENGSVTLKNDPIKGTIAFTKRAFNRPLADGTPNKEALGGAKFGLYKNATDIIPFKEATANTEVTSQGAVTFTEVPFGNYVIKEMEAPEGYIKSGGSIIVTKADMARTEANGGAAFTTDASQNPTFIYTIKDSGMPNTNAVDNQLAIAPVSIHKTDQNGKNIPEVKFEVKRYGDATTTVPTGTAYVPYPVDSPDSLEVGKEHIVKTNADGIAGLGNLMYGTYQIRETGQPEDIIHSAVYECYIQVDRVSNAVRVTKYKWDPKKGIPSGQTQEEEVLTKESQIYTVNVTNALKYGMVQIAKVAGTKTADGDYEVAYENGTTIPIKGAVFEIFAKAQVSDDTMTPPTLNGSQIPVLTIKTNEQGEFTYTNTEQGAEWWDDYGEYEDYTASSTNPTPKKLLIGDYYIREKAAPSGFMKDDLLRPFMVTWDDTQTEDGKKPQITKVGNKQEGTENYYIDEMSRAKVSLTKVDAADRAKVSDAEFLIYDASNDSAIASLREADSVNKKGYYTLSNQEPNNLTFVSKNEQGLHYLKENPAGEWELLSGSYYLVETTPPPGYVKDVDGSGNLQKHVFTIDDTNDIVIKNPDSNADSEFTNYKGKQNLLIQKAISVGDESVLPANASQKALDGFRFELSGTPVITADSYVTKTLATQNDGLANFSDIPYGTYTLKELEREDSDARKGNYILMSEKQLEVSMDGIKEIGSSSYFTKDTSGKYVFNVSNELKRGKITAKKTGTAGRETKVLQGAKFGLFSDSNAATPIVDGSANPITAVSDNRGNVTFEKLPYATYYVKEMAAPDGFSSDVTVRQIILAGENNGETVSISGNIENAIYKAGVELTKKDSTKTGTTDPSLTGAVFEIYGKNAPIKNKKAAYLLDKDNDGIYQLENNYEGNTLPILQGEKGLPCYVEEYGEHYLTAGNYYLKEVKAPEYYNVDAGSYPICVDDRSNGRTIKVSNITGDVDGIFTNTRIPSDAAFQKVYKITDRGEELTYGVAGAEFTLYTQADCAAGSEYKIKDGNGNAVSFTVESFRGSATQAAGRVTFANLPPGTYYLKETKVPDHFVSLLPLPIYEIKTDGNRTPTTITKAGDIKELTEIENTVKPDIMNTGLEVTLTNTAGTPLVNAEFAIYKDGILFAKARTNARGVLRFSGILPGIYTVRQLSSIEDYVPDELPKNLEVVAGGNYHIPVINQKMKQETAATGGRQAAVNSSYGNHAAKGKEVIMTQPSLTVLPKTGGFVGSIVLFLLGIALFGIGVWQLMIIKKNKQEQQKE